MSKLLIYLYFGIFAFTFVNAGSSRQCHPCPISNYPVCATNGTNSFLFKNECRVIAENVRRIMNKVPILQKTEIANCFRNCDQVCTDEYAPLCAKTTCDDQQTFANRCVLDLENCITGNNWRILHEGECPIFAQQPLSPFRPPQSPPPPPLPPSPVLPPPPPPLPPPLASPPAPTKPSTQQSSCPTICPAIYNPVCATFGGVNQTFSSLCHLISDMCKSGRKWKVKNNGECIDPEPKCHENCEKMYSPICATLNGESETFNNECLLNLEICQTGNRWDILHPGECEERLIIQETTVYEPPLPPSTLATPPASIPLPETQETFAYDEPFPVATFPPVPAPLLPQETIVIKEPLPVETLLPLPLPPPAPPAPPPIPAALLVPLSAPYVPQPEPLEPPPEPLEPPSTPYVPLPEPLVPPPAPYVPLTEPLIPPYAPYAPPPEPLLPPPAPYVPLPEPLVPPPTPYVPSPEPLIPPPAPYVPPPAPLVPPPVPSVALPEPFVPPPAPFVPPPENLAPSALPPPSAIPSSLPPLLPPEEPLPLQPTLILSGATGTFPNQYQTNVEMSQSNEPWQVAATVGESDPLTAAGTIAPTGPCPKCSDTYQPVCGFSNGEQKTFTNECQMIGENCYSSRKWVLLNEGECKFSNQRRGCPNICPLNYNPICASLNGIKRTFPNECELNHEAFRTNTQWVILNSGECDYCFSCPDEINPVCAENNGKMQTFENSCKMEFENCRTGSEWKIISRNSCESNQCPTFCPKIYSPICASNNGESRTFNNMCEMKMESCNTKIQWTVIGEGKCQAANVNCPLTCTLNYSPVCAMFQGVSKSFQNECMLRMEICKTKNNWKVVQLVACNSQLDVSQQPINTAQESGTVPVIGPVLDSVEQVPNAETDTVISVPPRNSIEQISNAQLISALIQRLRQSIANLNQGPTPISSPEQLAPTISRDRYRTM